MTKKEASDILLACKKHQIYISIRNEGDKYIVNFLNSMEIKNYDAAKYITNGLVLERRENVKKIKKIEKEETENLNFSKYSNRKKKSESFVTLEDRMRK